MLILDEFNRNPKISRKIEEQRNTYLYFVIIDLYTRTFLSIAIKMGQWNTNKIYSKFFSKLS